MIVFLVGASLRVGVRATAAAILSRFFLAHFHQVTPHPLANRVTDGTEGSVVHLLLISFRAALALL